MEENPKEFIIRTLEWLKTNCPDTFEHLFNPDWREE